MIYDFEPYTMRCHLCYIHFALNRWHLFQCSQNKCIYFIPFSYGYQNAFASFVVVQSRCRTYSKPKNWSASLYVAFEDFSKFGKLTCINVPKLSGNNFNTFTGIGSAICFRKMWKSFLSLRLKLIQLLSHIRPDNSPLVHETKFPKKQYKNNCVNIANW